jgi:fructokinase
MSDPRQPAVIVIGEAIADFLPDGAEGYRAVLGGSGVNTARALGRLDLSTRFVWSLSRDRLGRRFVEAMAADGVDLSRAAIVELPSALAIVEPAGSSAGDMFALHLAGTAHDAPPAIDAEAVGFRPGGHVHAASFAATVGPRAEDVLALLALAQREGSSSFDPNIRAACLPPREVALPLIEARVAASTIARASEDDLAWLYPALQPHEALQRWRMLGARLAIATRGASGALALGDDDSWCEAKAPAVDVVDTVGAGDTFTAGLLAALADSGALGRRGALLRGEALVRWLTFAARAASLACARAGCDPPRRDEVAALT